MASSTPAKKSSADQTPAKKTPTKKTPTKKPAAKKSSGPLSEARPPARASQVAASAAAELLELTGRTAEGVTGLERTDDGWTVQVEVVEVRRIPDTTDVLALYEVETDSHGALLGYRRVRRYTRGSAGDER